MVNRDIQCRSRQRHEYVRVDLGCRSVLFVEERSGVNVRRTSGPLNQFSSRVGRVPFYVTGKERDKNQPLSE